jgi:transcriptional antiterminator RfaH
MVNQLSTDRNSEGKEPSWYCVHTKSKSEHIAAAHLSQLSEELEVFSPRLRYLKKTARGKIWFTEALFPGYVFAHFALANWLRAVNHTNAVLRVVSFGGHHPYVPDEIIEVWRAKVDDDAVITVHEQLEEGDEIEIVEGPFRGLKTIITKVLPAKERVRILLEMLGKEREIELAVDTIRRTDRNVRAAAADLE